MENKSTKIKKLTFSSAIFSQSELLDLKKFSSLIDLPEHQAHIKSLLYNIGEEIWELHDAIYTLYPSGRSSSWLDKEVIKLGNHIEDEMADVLGQYISYLVHLDIRGEQIVTADAELRDGFTIGKDLLNGSDCIPTGTATGEAKDRLLSVIFVLFTKLFGIGHLLKNRDWRKSNHRVSVPEWKERNAKLTSTIGILSAFIFPDLKSLYKAHANKIEICKTRKRTNY